MDAHSQERRECDRADEHRPHQWGDNPGPFSGLWCPGNPDVTEGRA